MKPGDIVFFKNGPTDCRMVIDTITTEVHFVWQSARTNGVGRDWASDQSFGMPIEVGKTNVLKSGCLVFVYAVLETARVSFSGALDDYQYQEIPTMALRTLDD
jgi:hypothetical protein